MKKTVLLLTGIILLTLSGCLNPVNQPATGSLTLRMQDEVTAKTLLPSIKMDISTYDIHGSGPNGETFEQVSAAGNTAAFEKLAFGSWTVTVYGKNTDGLIIGKGEGTTEVRTGETSTVDITIIPLAGTGILDVMVDWDMNATDIPSIESKIINSKGEESVIGFGADPATDKPRCVRPGLATGYHTLTVKLLDNNILTAGWVEVVRIVKDQVTKGSIILDPRRPGGSIQVNMTPEMANPIPVLISGIPAVKSIITDENITLTASVPPETGAVTYVWYLDAEPVEIGSSYSFSAGETGPYRIDVTAFSIDGLRGGSTGEQISVVKKASDISNQPVTIKAPQSQVLYGSILVCEAEVADTNASDLRYSWFIDGIEQAGETSRSFHFSRTPQNMTDYVITVKVHDPNGSVIASSVTITVAGALFNPPTVQPTAEPDVTATPVPNTTPLPTSTPIPSAKDTINFASKTAVQAMAAPVNTEKTYTVNAHIPEGAPILERNEHGDFIFKDGLQAPIAFVNYKNIVFNIYNDSKQWTDPTEIIIKTTKNYNAYKIWIAPLNGIGSLTPEVLYKEITYNPNTEMGIYEFKVSLINEELKQLVVDKLNSIYKINLAGSMVPANFLPEQIQVVPFLTAYLQIPQYNIATVYPPEFDYKHSLSPLSLRFENEIPFRIELNKSIKDKLFTDMQNKTLDMSITYVIDGWKVKENRLNIFSNILKSSRFTNYLRGDAEFNYSHTIDTMHQSSSSTFGVALPIGPVALGASNSWADSSSSSTDSTSVKTFVDRNIMYNAAALALEDISINMWFEDEDSKDYFHNYANMFVHHLQDRFLPQTKELWDAQGSVIESQMDLVHKDFSPHRISSLTSDLTNSINSSSDNTIEIDKDLLSSINLVGPDKLFSALKINQSDAGSINSGSSVDTSVLSKYNVKQGAVGATFNKFGFGAGGTVSGAQQSGDSSSIFGAKNMKVQQYENGLCLDNLYYFETGPRSDSTVSDNTHFKNQVKTLLNTISDTSFSTNGEFIIPKSVNLYAISDASLYAAFSGRISQFTDITDSKKFVRYPVSYLENEVVPELEWLGTGRDGEIVIKAGHTVDIVDLYENLNVAGVTVNGKPTGLNHGQGSWNPKIDNNQARHMIHASNFIIEPGATLTVPGLHKTGDYTKGVVALRVKGNFVNKGTIDLSGKGYSGGIDPNERGWGPGAGPAGHRRGQPVPGGAGYPDVFTAPISWQNIIGNWNYLYGSGGGKGGQGRYVGGNGGHGGGAFLLFARYAEIGTINGSGAPGLKGSSSSDGCSGGGGGGAGGNVIIKVLMDIPVDTSKCYTNGGSGGPISGPASSNPDHGGGGGGGGNNTPGAGGYKGESQTSGHGGVGSVGRIKLEVAGTMR